MKINVNLENVFSKISQENNFNDDMIMPEINLNAVRQRTMNKIQQDTDKKNIPFKNHYTKIACATIVVFLITSGSVFAFGNEKVKNLISQLIGIQEPQVLVVGESISNKNYTLKIHEIVTDSYVGDVIASIEAISDKSKETFNAYQLNLNHIGSSYSFRELEEQRGQFIKYYEIGFNGATYQNTDKHAKKNLQFSIGGMKKIIEVPLKPTVQLINLDNLGSNSNKYKFNIHKIHLSEIGLSLEGTDTRNVNYHYWYKAELLFTDGKKILVSKESDSKDNDNEKPFISSGSFRSSSDTDKDVTLSMSFRKSIPLHTIKQVIINDVAYDIEQ